MFYPYTVFSFFNKKIFLKFFLFIFVGSIFFEGSSYGYSSSKEDSILPFLVICTGRKERSFFLVLFSSQQHFFHVHRLNSKMQMLEQQKKDIPLELLSDSQAKVFVENIFGISIQKIITVGLPDIFSLLKDMGGISIFNLESSIYPKGRLVVDESNFFTYIDGIKNKDIRNDVVFSLVISILQKSLQLDRDLFQKKTVSLLKRCSKTRVFNKEYQKIFLDLVDNVDNISLEYSRMNVDERFFKDSSKRRIVPLVTSGEIFDKKKIHLVIQKLINFSPSNTEIPITVQVRNATDISRLAARISGFLQRRKFFVSEFLNSSIPIENSLIISRSLSPLKLQQIQKYTKIPEWYYIVDYRESSDFAIFLSRDFFMVKQ